MSLAISVAGQQCDAPGAGKGKAMAGTRPVSAKFEARETMGWLAGSQFALALRSAVQGANQEEALFLLASRVAKEKLIDGRAPYPLHQELSLSKTHAMSARMGMSKLCEALERLGASGHEAIPLRGHPDGGINNEEPVAEPFYQAAVHGHWELAGRLAKGDEARKGALRLLAISARRPVSLEALREVSPSDWALLAHAGKFDAIEEIALCALDASEDPDSTLRPSFARCELPEWRAHSPEIARSMISAIGPALSYQPGEANRDRALSLALDLLTLIERERMALPRLCPWAYDLPGGARAASRGAKPRERDFHERAMRGWGRAPVGHLLLGACLSGSISQPAIGQRLVPLWCASRDGLAKSDARWDALSLLIERSERAAQAMASLPKGYGAAANLAQRQAYEAQMGSALQALARDPWRATSHGGARSAYSYGDTQLSVNPLERAAFQRAGSLIERELLDRGALMGAKSAKKRNAKATRQEAKQAQAEALARSELLGADPEGLLVAPAAPKKRGPSRL